MYVAAFESTRYIACYHKNSKKFRITDTIGWQNNKCSAINPSTSAAFPRFNLSMTHHRAVHSTPTASTSHINPLLSAVHILPYSVYYSLINPTMHRFIGRFMQVLLCYCIASVRLSVTFKCLSTINCTICFVIFAVLRFYFTYLLT